MASDKSFLAGYLKNKRKRSRVEREQLAARSRLPKRLVRGVEKVAMFLREIRRSASFVQL
jgi:hypothetical protein